MAGGPGRPLVRCPHCAGEGEYHGRPYGQARPCEACGRVFNPPLSPTDRQARFCTFHQALPGPDPDTKSAPTAEAWCWACGNVIHPLPVGRPRRFCEVCHPYRRHQRRYRRARTAVTTS